jgi:general secretion pathway protein F
VPNPPLDPHRLVLLADELRALMRAGLPLTAGLREASTRWPRDLSDAANRMTDRLECGAPFDQELKTNADFPEVFRAILGAGLKSGRLPETLHAYADAARQTLSLRETLTRGMIYPIVLCILAFGLFVALMVFLEPQFAATFRVFHLQPPFWLVAADDLRRSLPIWSWGVPLAVIVGWWLWSWAVRRGLVASSIFLRFFTSVARAIDPTGWLHARLISLPLAGNVRRDMRLCGSSRLLALMLAHDVPLPMALRLAAPMAPTGRMKRALERAADDAEQGRPFAQIAAEETAYPALWRSLFATVGSQEQLAAGFEQVAEMYGYRATSAASAAGRVWPTLLVILVGGGATFLYASAVFYPLAELWKGLGVPTQ